MEHVFLQTKSLPCAKTKNPEKNNKSNSLGILFSIVLIMLKVSTGFSQTLIPSTTTIVQNFDGMGSTLTLPANWKVGAQTAAPTYGTASSSVTVQASSGTPATGGTYNWGAGAADRAVGALTSGGFASPNSVIGFFRNTNASTLTSLTVAYDLERYRINSAAASVQFFYSTDGTNWTSVPAGDIATASLPTGASVYSFAPTGAPTATNAGVINKTGITISGLNIATNGDIYLRWNLNTTGANSQGIGVDNINVTAAFAVASPTMSASPSTLTGFTYAEGSGPSIAQTFTITASNLTAGGGSILIDATGKDYEVSTTSPGTGGYGATATLTYTGTGTISPNTVWVRLKTGLTAGNYNSETIAVSGGGASSTVTASGTVTAAAPANDNCSNAISITAGSSCVSTSGTTVSATQQFGPTSCNSSLSSSANDVWYSFTTDGTSSYTINATNTASGAASDIVVGLYSSCASTSLISCADAVVSGTETISAGTLATGTYFYRIYGYNGASGTFTTCVTIACPAFPTLTLANQSRCGNGDVTFTVTNPGNGMTVEWSTDGVNANDGTGFTKTKTLTVGSPVTVYARYSSSATCKGAWVSATGTANTFTISTVFSENVGTPSSNTNVNSYSGWQNNASLSFSTTDGNTDVRITTPSSGYTGASGNGNVFLGIAGTNNRNFQISNINTSGATNLVLSFGALRDNTTNGLTVEVSSDGTNYTPLTVTQPPVANTWALITASGAIPVTSNLRIRFSKNNSTSFRIDDIKLSKDPSNTATISAGGPTTFCTPGSVTLTASSASSYLWSNNATTQSITASASGSFSAVLTDANGCSATSNTITVSAVPGPALFTVTGGGGYCSGGSGVDVSLSGSESSASYQLLLNGNPLGSPVSGTGSGISFGNQATAGNYTVTASNGSCTNTMTGSVTVTINTAPVITCPGNVSVSNTSGQCGANVTYPSPATATGTPASTITYSPASGSLFPVGTTTVTATATNSCGSNSCTFTVTVVDGQAPAAACKNITVNLDGSGNASITAADINNGSSDNCGTPSLSASRTSFNCSDVVNIPGPTDLIISEYLEGSGNNKAIEIFNGTANPVNLTTGGYNLFLSRNGGTTTTTFNLTGTIAAGGTFVFANSASNSSILSVANQTSSTLDFNGNDAVVLKKGAANVDIFGVVGDNPGTAWTGSGGYSTLDKTLRRKSNVTSGVTTNPSGSGATAFTTLTTEWDLFATDNSTGLGSHSIASASGVAVTLTVSDASGNSSTCNATVTVKDVTAPGAPILANVTGECSATATAPVASDICSGNVTGTTSDATTYNTQGTHIIHWTFTDESGNVSTATQNVIVDDVTPPAAPALANATGECSVTVSAPTAADNCAGTITGTTTDPTTYSTQGSYTVTWSFNDGNGNVSTSAQNVIVDDVTPPAAPVLANAIGECSVTVSAPTASDNCAGTITGTTTDPTTYSTQGSYIVTWSFNDGNGNVSSATQNVIVDDVTAPAAPVLADATGECSVTVSAPTASDNCAGTITGTTTDPTTYSTQGTYTVTWSFNDGNGNVSTSTQNVIVDDVTAPAAPVLADATGECSVTVSAPTASDNCAGTITGTTTDPTTYSTQGSYTVTWSFNDGNGNVSTSTQNVIVDDITAPAAPVLADATGECSVTVPAPTATDNCAGTITGTTTDPTSYSTQGSYTITWSFDDGNGNVSTSTQNVIVNDVTPPSITCPSSIEVSNTPGSCSAAVTYNVSFSDNCSGASLNQTGGLSSGNNFPVGTTSNSFTVTDAGGNSASCSFTVTVTDNENPTITCPADVSAYTNTGCTATGVDLGTPVTSDNCSVTSVTNNSTGTYPLGTTVVIWTVTDGSGHTATCSQAVTVTKNPVPFITCPANVVVNTTTGCSATGVSIGSPNTSNNCGGVTVANNHPSTSYPAGTTNVIWTVTDNISHNTSTCTQTVTVREVIPPTISCPPNKTATVSASCTATITLVNPITSDNCSVASVSNNHPGTSYPLGVTTVIWTVTDGSGNTSSCSQTVTATDVTRPTISCPAAVVIGMNSACTATGVNLGTPAAADNCTVAGVANNHASSTYPKGATTVIWTVTDGAGLTATCSQSVTVNDNVKPTITCPANVAVNTNTGCTATGVSVGTPATSDNCTVSSVASNHASTSYPLGTTTIVWTVTDGSANTSTCSQAITVSDNIKPTISCPPNKTVAANSGCNATGVSSGSAFTSDNCTVASTVNNHPGTTYPIGITVVTWTVTDASGNSSSCSNTVTVTGTCASLSSSTDPVQDGQQQVVAPVAPLQTIVKVADPVSAFMIKTYPNPFSSEVHLRVYTMDKSPVSLKIFDASGQIMETQEDVSYDLNDVLIGKSLPAGMYLIQVTQGKNMQVERVVKVQ